jgi:hypothetical protein
MDEPPIFEGLDGHLKILYVDQRASYVEPYFKQVCAGKSQDRYINCRLLEVCFVIYSPRQSWWLAYKWVSWSSIDCNCNGRSFQCKRSDWIWVLIAIMHSSLTTSEVGEG